MIYKALKHIRAGMRLTVKSRQSPVYYLVIESRKHRRVKMQTSKGTQVSWDYSWCQHYMYEIVTSCDK